MILIADNLQAAHSIIEDAINSRRPEPIQKLVRRCVDSGAHMIDINAGPLPRDGDKKMAFLVDTVQEVCELPIVLDTANHLAIEAGLQTARNPVIINGFSLEPHKLEHILPLAKRYQADIIGYLLTPEGHVLRDADQRLEIAVELLGEFQKAGLATEKLIIDPLVVPVIWHDGHIQAGEVLRAISNLPDVMGFEVRTVAGLSNLTAGSGRQPRKFPLEQTYLSMLAAAGLDMVLLDIFHAETVETAKASDALIGKKPFAWDGW